MEVGTLRVLIRKIKHTNVIIIMATQGNVLLVNYDSVGERFCFVGD